MFAARYFTARAFAARYFPKAAAPGAPSTQGGGPFARRFFTGRYFPARYFPPVAQDPAAAAEAPYSIRGVLRAWPGVAAALRVLPSVTEE